LVGPIAANMTKATEEEHAFLYVMRVLMVSFLKGTAPIMAVEMARRAVPGHVRPSFKELESACRNKTPDGAAPEAPAGGTPEAPAEAPAEESADAATTSS
jgi:chemotaxis protein MotA